MEKEFMTQALKEAEKAAQKLEIPVGAIISSRIKKIYIGTNDPRTGAAGSVLNLFEDYKFNHKVEVKRGILKDECKKILSCFFTKLRNQDVNL